MTYDQFIRFNGLADCVRARLVFDDLQAGFNVPRCPELVQRAMAGAQVEVAEVVVEDDEPTVNHHTAMIDAVCDALELRLLGIAGGLA